MEPVNLTWFYFHCLLATIVLVKDYNGTLEESLNNFEKSIVLYTEVDTTDNEEKEITKDIHFDGHKPLKRNKRSPLFGSG